MEHQRHVNGNLNGSTYPVAAQCTDVATFSKNKTKQSKTKQNKTKKNKNKKKKTGFWEKSYQRRVGQENLKDVLLKQEQ